MLFFNTSFFSPLKKALEDFSFLDVYYAEQLDQKQSLDPNIILVNIEHKTRSELALALKRVLKDQPKVVGFDIILKEFEKTAADTLLAELLNTKKVVSTYTIQTDTTKISNHHFFDRDETSGYANFNFDKKSSVIREFKGVQKYNGNYKTSFMTAVAMKYISKESWKKKNMDSKLAKARVINYRGDLDHYINLTVDEVMKLEGEGLLKDKVVLFGYIGSPTGNNFDIEDKHFTPLNEITSGKSVPDMNGVVIHANILSMLLSDRFMHKVSTFWSYVLMFICSFLATIYFMWLDKRLSISFKTVRKAILFAFTVLLVWITLLLFKNGIVLKSAPIIAVTVFSAGFNKYYNHITGYIKTKTEFETY